RLIITPAIAALQLDRGSVKHVKFARQSAYRIKVSAGIPNGRENCGARSTVTHCQVSHLVEGGARQPSIHAGRRVSRIRRKGCVVVQQEWAGWTTALQLEISNTRLVKS